MCGTRLCLRGSRLQTRHRGCGVIEALIATVSLVGSPVLVEVVAVEDLDAEAGASRRLVARWSDGTVSEALRWFADEWLVSEGDLVGKTAAEIRSLVHRRDVQYLQQPERPERMPFFD